MRPRVSWRRTRVSSTLAFSEPPFARTPARDRTRGGLLFHALSIVTSRAVIAVLVLASPKSIGQNTNCATHIGETDHPWVAQSVRSESRIADQIIRGAVHNQ